jgi:hypothetical protein
VSGVNAKRICAVAGLVTVISAAVAAPAPAALQVSQFSLTPSTQRAGGHPSVALSTAFLGADTNSGVKSIALRLPAGLRTRPSVASVCSARLLIRNDCPIPSRVGQVKVLGSAFGTSATITRDIYRTRAQPGEVARLSVIALPGIPVTLPLTRRADGGIDVAITGLPQVGGAITAQLDKIELRFKSSIRRRWLLANPRSCGPATTTIEIGFHDPAVPAVSAASSFTPSGC